VRDAGPPVQEGQVRDIGTGNAGPRPSLTVIVPTCNRPHPLERLLGQLGRQTLARDRFEVVVVDDGSDVEVKSALTGGYDFDLSIVRQARAGSAAARQFGADRARGDVIVLLDDDMEVPPGFLEAHRAHHGEGDRLVVLGRVRPGADLRTLPLLERYRLGYADRLGEEVQAGRQRLTSAHVYTGNMSLRRTLLEEAGGFDTELSLIHDVELAIRLEQIGARFVLSGDAWSVHGRDGRSTEEWLTRFADDGMWWSKVAAKHPGEITAQPWHLLDLVNPASRPLLALSAIAPSASGVLARSVLASASAADAIGLKRVALAGATVLYGVQMFRGAGRAAGGGRAAFAQYREYRRAFGDVASTPESSAYRRLTAAIGADYKALVETRARYDPDRPAPRSPTSAFAVNIGFQLVVAYRLMRYMRELDLPLAAQVVGRAIRHLYGSDIHPEAELAPGLVIVHGFGLAVSHAVRTSPGCILSHNVTLGDGRDATTGAVGAPTLDANVVIGNGSSLFGPITVGTGSKVMPGCTVYQSVPPYTIVESPAISMRPRDPGARDPG
jgi:serine acetyltransferase/glycosyltransferase involved in cell wall biosynthesis